MRDRYRRDYRSVPIPTPPRAAPPRTNANPSGDVVATPQPVAAPTQPQTPPPQSQVQPPQPQPSSPPEPPQTPPVAVSTPVQAQAPKATKRSSRATKKAQKKAHKQARKQERLGHKGKRLKRLILVPIIAVVILALLGGGGLFGYQQYQKRRPLPIDRSYINASDFPLYLPQNLPAGYAIDKSTLDHQDNALVFTIRNSSDEFKSVQVSQQKLPAAFNPDKQLPDNPAGPGQEDRKFTTSVGKVEIATWQDRLVASLGTPKTWIIMNISSVPSADADAIAKSFQPLDTTPAWLQKIEARLHITSSFTYIIKVK